MSEEMTIYDIMTLASDNFDAVEKVWKDLIKMNGEGVTILQATVEWAKRNGREIRIVDSKKGK